MTLITKIKIFEIGQGEYSKQIKAWSCGLWWEDFEEAAISRCLVAIEGDIPVAFQTINGDGRCVAIEVHPDYQGQGIASALVEESGCYRPERNENSEFWAAMAEKFGDLSLF